MLDLSGGNGKLKPKVMKDAEELLSEFRAAAEQVLFRHTSRFKGLNQKDSKLFYEEFAKIWKGFHEDLAQATIDNFNKVESNAKEVDTAFVARVLKLNGEYTTWFAKAVNPHS